jgi:hypothetical protein
MYWDNSTTAGAKVCKLYSDDSVLARFQHSLGLRSPDQPPSLNTLEVLPAGFKYLDDIVVSVLAIERKRLTPASPIEQSYR